MADKAGLYENSELATKLLEISNPSAWKGGLDDVYQRLFDWRSEILCALKNGRDITSISSGGLKVELEFDDVNDKAPILGVYVQVGEL